MKKADKTKLLYVIGISLVLFMFGCVDTNVQNVPSSIDYHSQVKFVNLIDSVGTATISVNGNSMGSAAFTKSLPANGSSYLDVQSGDKVIIVKYTSAPADTFRIAFETERTQSIYFTGTKSGSRQITSLTERYTWQAKNSKDGAPLYPADTASVLFFNGASDAGSVNITIKGGSLDTTLAKAAVYGGNLPFFKLKAGSYTFTFTNATKDTLSTLSNAVVSSSNRYNAAIFGVKGNYQSKLFTDD